MKNAETMFSLIIYPNLIDLMSLKNIFRADRFQTMYFFPY